MNDQPKIFRPSKLKFTLLLLGCSAFVAIGIYILKNDPMIGWACICFFGLGVLVSLIHFFPNASYLKLTDQGFEVKSLFKSSFTQWSDVKDFRIGHINGNAMIFFDFTEKHNKWKKGKKVAKFLSGKEGALQSSYSISSKELLALMLDYKKKSS